MKKSHSLSRQRGFTLIELLVVILILGILAALIVPKVIGQQEGAKIGAAKSSISNLAAALDTFRVQCDRYPTTEEGLQALVTPPSGLEDKWKGPYIGQINPDPWGHPFLYKSNNSTDYMITSTGPSGTEGNADNITQTSS